MMKGASAAIEAVGRIMISVFIIGVIVILLAEFLPSVFGDSACKQKQVDNLNSIISDAQSTGFSQQYKSFSVQSCVSYIDFGNLVDCQVHLGNGGSKVEDRKCYEISYVGKEDSNCNTILKDPPIPAATAKTGTSSNGNTDTTTIDRATYCKTHLGTFYPLPGATNDVLQNVIQFDPSGSLKLVPGDYSVVINPYSIKFLAPQ